MSKLLKVLIKSKIKKAKLVAATKTFDENELIVHHSILDEPEVDMPSCVIEPQPNNVYEEEAVDEEDEDLDFEYDEDEDEDEDYNEQDVGA